MQGGQILNPRQLCQLMRLIDQVQFWDLNIYLRQESLGFALCHVDLGLLHLSPFQHGLIFAVSDFDGPLNLLQEAQLFFLWLRRFHFLRCLSYLFRIWEANLLVEVKSERDFGRLQSLIPE